MSEIQHSSYRVANKPNMNFEEDTRHDLSRKTLSNLERVMHKQDDFGIEKYGKALNSNMKYDWHSMFLEEMADGLKYLQCEMERKEEVIKLLEAAIRVDNPKEYVQTALELLKIGGTGK
jgi:translation elongation factor EF-1beta